MATKIFCDFCGKEVPEHEDHFYFETGTLNVVARVSEARKEAEGGAVVILRDPDVCVECIVSTITKGKRS